MRCDAARSAALCAEAGIELVKSTGWFRSPYADALVGDADAAELAARLGRELEEGRASVVGELGISGTTPTAVERRLLDAAATTSAPIVLHTDDWANAAALVEELVRRGVPHERLLVGHLRCADPIEGQTGLAL